MITIYDKATGDSIGVITERELQFLKDQLEEEWLEDKDYAITTLLLDAFEAQGSEARLVSLLRDALGGREAMEIVWADR
jgi:processive 1,2-diacylglycerol beta-glucosyltransferase